MHHLSNQVVLFRVNSPSSGTRHFRQGATCPDNTLRGELFALAPDVAPQHFLASDCIPSDPGLIQEQSVFALQNISCLSPLTAKEDE
jgi:hypothetical protein